MIDLYTWSTANGIKIPIMLEEVGLPYRVIPVDISKGEQNSAEFRRINPYGKIPAIVDGDGPGSAPYSIFDSGAILVYLADKSGQLLATEKSARFEAMQWLFFHGTAIVPMFQQLRYFKVVAPGKSEFALERYIAETKRATEVVESHLREMDYLAGEYSIADIAMFATLWVATHVWGGMTLDPYPNIAEWMDRIAARPAVKKGMNVPRPLIPA